MMRGPEKSAMAVRRQNGLIFFEEEVHEKKKRPLLLRLPIVRGVFAFADSLRLGYKYLMRSAEISGLEELEEEAAKAKKEKKAQKAKSLERSLEAQIPEEVYDRLEKEMEAGANG